MIHGLLFWLDDWESLKFGPDQIRIWSLDQSAVVRTSGVCCPDHGSVWSGLLVSEVGTKKICGSWLHKLHEFSLVIVIIGFCATFPR
jgi:hypothetical protein